MKRNEGILPPDPEMAKWYDEAAAQPPVRFDDEHQRVLIDSALDIASRRSWRVHAVANEPSHIHVLISWPDDAEHDWKHVRDKLKQLLGMLLSKHFNVRDRRWFVHKSSRRRVKTRGHFEYLMTDYLPSHSGRIWSEREHGAQAHKPVATRQKPAGKGVR